ncbi:MAG: ABC transporter permease [Anaerolineaceae bacterium]|nr:ABC transporter permease [Anaerolineaceae bacterium]
MLPATGIDISEKEQVRKRGWRWQPILATMAGPVIGVVVGLLIGAVLILVAKADPIKSYAVLFNGAFGGMRQITETLIQACPIMIIGLGMCVAYRARVWNIGAEGQYFMGALFGGIVALYLPPFLPRIILLPAMLLMGILGGALWGLIPAVFKIKKGINEIISTLMLNYIAILLVQYLARGPLQEPNGYLPQSAQFASVTQLPLLFGSRIHIGIIIAVLLAPIVFSLIWSTPLGFKLRAVGSRASVARYAGARVEGVIIFSMVFSGAMAGLAGIIQVMTYYTRLKGDISLNYGFSGILVAMLGRLNPFGVVVASIFFAALTIGAQSMHVVYQLPVDLATAIQAIVVLSVLAVDSIIRRRFPEWIGA